MACFFHATPFLLFMHSLMSIRPRIAMTMSPPLSILSISALILFHEPPASNAHSHASPLKLSFAPSSIPLPQSNGSIPSFAKLHPPTECPNIYCENLGATYFSANPIFRSRMKHLALAFHIVREQVQLGTIRVTHIFSNNQLAEILTKPLSKARFYLLAAKLELTLRPSDLRGRVKDNNPSQLT